MSSEDESDFELEEEQEEEDPIGVSEPKVNSSNLNFKPSRNILATETC